MNNVVSLPGWFFASPHVVLMGADNRQGSALFATPKEPLKFQARLLMDEADCMITRKVSSCRCKPSLRQNGDGEAEEVAMDLNLMGTRFGCGLGQRD